MRNLVVVLHTYGAFTEHTFFYISISINQAFLFLKKKKVPSNTFTERETQENEETTQRQSVKTCDMKIVIHIQKKNNKKNTHGRDT